MTDGAAPLHVEPDYAITTLANGLRVVTDPMPHLASASLGVWVGAGARHEAADENGVAHFLEHMAFKGTATRSARAIAEEIEDVGGDLNAFTERELTSYHARVLAEDVGLALGLLADIVRKPAYDAEELELERGVILQEIGEARDTPDEVVFDWAQEIAFPDQPIGRSILGRDAVVRGLGREALLSFVGAHYRPSEMVISAAGAVRHDEIVARAEAHFADLTEPGSRPLEPAAYHGGGERRGEKDLEQVNLVLGFPAPGYRDDAFFTAQAYSMLLGGGMSSRLFQEAREARGLCYDISSYLSPYRETGFLTIYSGSSGEEAPALMSVIVDELKAVADGVREDEVARAKAQMRASLLMGMESPHGRAERAARAMLAQGHIRPIAAVLQEIEEVSREGVAAFAQGLLTGAEPTLALYGPVAGAPDLAALTARMAA